MKPCLVSACLLGIHCRWDGACRPSMSMIALAKIGEAIPVCPEQLGGLPTPREPAELGMNGKVLTKSGKDVTDNFIKGAQEVLCLAKLYGCGKAVLASKSPSCGLHTYDGTFSGKIIKNHAGVTADLLQKNGILVESFGNSGLGE